MLAPAGSHLPDPRSRHRPGRRPAHDRALGAGTREKLELLRSAPVVDWAAIRQLKSVAADLGRNGRILIRPSGTEPLLRVMVEAESESVAASAAKRLVASLEGAV